MTRDEFLSSVKSNGAVLAPAAEEHMIVIASSALQSIRCAMLPEFMIDLYKTAGGLVLGDGYIFGPSELTVTRKFPVPSIVQINNEISGLAQMRGKTVFGRNDLFWFAFDVFGACFMLDNLTLSQIRKYEDPWRALSDCLIIGKM